MPPKTDKSTKTTKSLKTKPPKTTDTQTQEFGETSILLTSKLSKDEKKDGGIFFTPRAIVNKALTSALTAFGRTPVEIDILEPSCGSGEFIDTILANPIFTNNTTTSISRQQTTARITAIEFNNTIFQEINKKYTQQPQTGDNQQPIKLFHADFLTWKPTNETDAKYDLIIGNPPYFTMKKSDVAKTYYQYFDGRPNIYIIFIIKCMRMLKPGGVLSFVLPCNFLNSVYYNKLRQFISNPANNYQICDIINCGGDNFYIDTDQNTVIWTIKYLGPEPSIAADMSAPRINNSRFLATIRFKDAAELVIWNSPDAISIIRTALVGSVSLDSLGFEVSVGSVVWNQHKPKLTDDPADTLLIYNSNLVNGRLEIQQFKNAAKKNYIRMPADIQTPATGPVLLVNRGYGVGSYSFDYYCGNPGRPYFVENHLIVIRPKPSDNPDQPAMDTDTLTRKYAQITASFTNPKTAQFIKNYFSNNAINTTELQFILPIYLH